MRTLGGAAAVGVACAFLFGMTVGAAAAQTSAAPGIVTATEQRARDAERVRILQAELSREHRKVAKAAQRRAERLSARDAPGAQEAEQSRARAADNIAALQREIELASKPASSAASARLQAPPAAASDDGPRAPWWDVYAKAPRPVAATATLRPSAVPSSPGAPTALYHHRASTP